MRRFISLTMILALLLALSACGGKADETKPVSETTIPPATTEVPAAAPTDSAPSAPAATGDGISWNVANGTLTISGRGAMDDYELLSAPWDEAGESIGVERLVVEEGVSYLGSYAFAACPNLSEVSLPASLRGIGSFCFADCLALESVTFNKGLIFIGESAFAGAGIKSIALPDGFAAIGERSFTLCASLEEVSLPDSLCSLGEAAFVDCAALNKIEIGSGATAEGLLENAGLGELLSYSGTAIPAENYPWSGEASGEYGSCSWALQHGVLTISGSVIPSFSTAGGKQAPWAPMAALIREVHLTENVSSIGDYAFWGCSGLSAVKLPAGINYIGAYAFGACQSLAHFDFPTALDTIGEGAFSLCSALTEAELPVGLVHIDDDAFQMCTSLQHISIPASVTEIGSGALSFGGEEPAEIIAPAGSYAEQWVKDNL